MERKQRKGTCISTVADRLSPLLVPEVEEREAAQRCLDDVVLPGRH